MVAIGRWGVSIAIVGLGLVPSCTLGHGTAADKAGGQCRQPTVVSLRPVVFNRDVLSFDVAGFGEALVECGHQRCTGAGRRTAEIPDHRHRLLLRTNDERPGCGGASTKDQEIAPIQSFTSPWAIRQTKLLCCPSTGK
jgi:hypothetical protein